MLRVFPDKGTVLVEHVRVVKKTVSSKQGQRTKGGIAEQESPINISNVALVCPNCGVARVGFKKEGTTKRASARSVGRSCPRRSSMTDFDRPRRSEGSAYVASTLPKR